MSIFRNNAEFIAEHRKLFDKPPAGHPFRPASAGVLWDICVEALGRLGDAERRIASLKRSNDVAIHMLQNACPGNDALWEELEKLESQS